MTSVADKLGFGPKREEERTASGWNIVVTAPGAETPNKVFLSEEQFERYLVWKKDGGLIQDLLPDLSDSDREIIKTGIGPEEWDEMFRGDER